MNWDYDFCKLKFNDKSSVFYYCLIDKLLMLGLLISPKKLPTDLLTFREDNSFNCIFTYYWLFLFLIYLLLELGALSLFLRIDIGFPYFFMFWSALALSDGIGLGVISISVSEMDLLYLFYWFFSARGFLSFYVLFSGSSLLIES